MRWIRFPNHIAAIMIVEITNMAKTRVAGLYGIGCSANLNRSLRTPLMKKPTPSQATSAQIRTTVLNVLDSDPEFTALVILSSKQFKLQIFFMTDRGTLLFGY